MTSGRRKNVFCRSLIVLLTVVVSLVNSATIDGPEDTAGTVGETSTMTCTSTLDSGDAATIWQYYPTPSAVVIYNSKDTSPSRIPGFSVESLGSGRYDLTILNVSLDLGVLYECKTDFSDVKKEARFTALDRMICPASSTEVFEGDEVVVACSVKYRGEVPPSLTWTDDNWLNITSDFYRTDGFAEASMNITMGPEHDDVVFTCLLDFNDTGVAYTTNCTTFYYVFHNVTAIEMEPPADENGYLGYLEVGSNITCIAGGRPSPDFVWTDMADNTVLSNTENVTITEDMATDELKTFLCTASNEVNGVFNSQELNVTFNVGTDPSVVSSSVEAWVIAVAVVVPIVVLAAAGIGGYCLYRYCRNKKDKKKTTTPTTPTATTTTATISRYNASSDPTTEPFLGSYNPSSQPPQQQPISLGYSGPTSNGNYGTQPPAPRPGTLNSSGSDRNSSGFADLGAPRVIPGVVPGSVPVATHPGSNFGSSSRLYAAPQPVSMRPNPVTYPYQPPQSVAGTGPPGSVRPQSASSQSSSRAPSFYGTPGVQGPPPATSGMRYAPSIDASHHSSLV